MSVKSYLLSLPDLTERLLERLEKRRGRAGA